MPHPAMLHSCHAMPAMACYAMARTIITSPQPDSSAPTDGQLQLSGAVAVGERVAAGLQGAGLLGAGQVLQGGKKTKGSGREGS